MKPISRPTRRSPPSRLGLVVALALASAAAWAQDARTRSAPASDRAFDSEIEHYCGNLAPTASEARASYQARQLAELEERVRKAAEDLERRAAEAREWVDKRDAMMKAATEDLVAVYAKMPSEAAAPQIAEMDELMAAALLAKLNPRVASAILGEMTADKAAKLAALMAGATGADKS